jgi:hypothetical protein
MSVVAGGVLPPRLLERIAAGAAGLGAVDDLEASVTEHRARGLRTVHEYRLDGGLRLFAKRYPRCEDAQASFDLLRRLEESGFGPGSAFRVAEPVACFAEWGVVVVRAAPGVCAASLTDGGGSWGEEGIRAAARWLAHLHTRHVDGNDPGEDRAHGVFRMARRGMRAVARHPDLTEPLVRLIEELAERSGAVRERSTLTQTHGRYHAEHVFVAPEAVTVIDLDRAALADPGKDVGEFLHRVRMRERRALPGAAPPNTTLVFVEEYAACAGGIPASLVYYWSHSVLSTLLRVLELGRPRWERRLAFYRAEFQAIPAHVATLADAGVGVAS